MENLKEHKKRIQKEWRERNKDYIKQKRHKRYLKNKEKEIQCCKKYYAEHRDEILFQAKNRYRIKCGLKPLKRN